MSIKVTPQVNLRGKAREALQWFRMAGTVGWLSEVAVHYL
jgi:hypothetical protein